MAPRSAGKKLPPIIVVDERKREEERPSRNTDFLASNEKMITSERRKCSSIGHEIADSGLPIRDQIFASLDIENRTVVIALRSLIYRHLTRNVDIYFDKKIFLKIST